jgi:hypothetical protein
MKKRRMKVEGGAIEMLGEGNQFVACGTHSSGVRYELAGGLPDEIPTLNSERFEKLWSVLTQKFAVEPVKDPSPSTPTDSAVLTEIDDASWSELIVALRYMLDKVASNEVWSSVGYALLSIQKSRQAKDLWLDFSRKAVNYTVGAPEAWWDAHCTQIPRSDYRHIFNLAIGAGWRRHSDPGVFTPVASVPGSGDSLPDPLPPAPDKPVVKIEHVAFDQTLDRMEEVLKPEIYVQAREFVRLSNQNLNDGVRRFDNVVMLRASRAWVRKRLNQIATFIEYRKEEWHKAPCPQGLVMELMDLGDWPQLRLLDAIARAPFLREDGSICDVPGYDQQSRSLYVPSGAFPDIPKLPTRGDAESALARLLEPFGEFPWYTPAAKSAFVAHILTEAARIAIERSPIFWYTAPDAGTGKTMLSEMASLIVHGTEPALRPWVSDADEMRKTLFSSLLAGDRSIAFDNVPTGFKARSPELCGFVTAAVWKDRKLGASEVQAFPNKAVVSASGNNLTPTADVARRSLVVRLDANSTKLKERRFKISNLRYHVWEQRPALLVDALTIIKAYLASGERVDTVLMQSFENWTKFCCEPLMWLGMPDPRETQKTETDDETASLGPIFSRLASIFGDYAFHAMDISRQVGSLTDQNGELGQMLINTGCAEPNEAKTVGYWLRANRDKRTEAWKLVHAGVDMHGAKWQFKRDDVNEDLA